MNKNTEYLEHEINLYKNLPLKERHKGKRTNYQIMWKNIQNHKNLINIAELYNLDLSDLIKIILTHFLKCRKKYKEIRNKLNVVKYD